MNIGNLTVGVEIDQAKLTEGINNVNQTVTTASSNMATILRAAFTLFTSGLIAKGIMNCVNAFAEEEVIVVRLNTALKMQNIYTERLSNQLKDEAKALMWATGYEDEAIMAGQAFALNMGVSINTIKQITPLVLDFATAMGLDLETAFRVVGKAALGQYDTLKRYGIIIPESELKTKGFNVVLEKLQKTVRGTSEELNRTTKGELTQFKNMIGEISESIGEKFAEKFNHFVRTIKIELRNLREGKENIIPNMMKEITTGVPKAGKVILNLQESFEQVTLAADALDAEIQALAKNLGSTISGAILSGKDVLTSFRDFVTEQILQIIIQRLLYTLGIAQALQAVFAFFSGGLSVIPGIGALISGNVKKYHTGIQNVSEKTLAVLHPGEAVIPRELNPYLGKSMQSETAGAGSTNNIYIQNPTVRKDEDWDVLVRKHIIPALDRYKRKTYTSPFA
jgi:hypothetical protein